MHINLKGIQIENHSFTKGVMLSLKCEVNADILCTHPIQLFYVLGVVTLEKSKLSFQFNNVFTNHGHYKIQIEFRFHFQCQINYCSSVFSIIYI